MPLDVVYFTKEDGKNIFLQTSQPNRISSIGLDKSAKKSCEIVLGHKLLNLYALIDGVEFDMMPYLNTSYEDLIKGGAFDLNE